MRRKKFMRWAVIIVFVYILGGVILYFIQDYILFRPLSLKRDHKYDFKLPHEDIDIPVNKKDTLNLVRFLTADSTPRGVVLYFHGNKRNISRYAIYPPYFTKHGYEVLIIDYPGFGKSIGKFNEQTLYDWSYLVYDLARSKYAASDIIIYGKSMGTGIAAHLAFQKPCKRLILETPYYNFPSVVGRFLPIYPVQRIIHYKFPTNDFLPHVKAPITIFHGTNDGVIAYRNAKKLIPLLKPTDEFITIPQGSHNNLYEFPLMVNKLDSLLKN